jgi:hypothetical protein
LEATINQKAAGGAKVQSEGPSYENHLNKVWLFPFARKEKATLCSGRLALPTPWPDGFQAFTRELFPTWNSMLKC